MQKPLLCCAMVKATTLGDPRLVHPVAGRAEDSTAATADSSPSHVSLGLLCICNNVFALLQRDLRLARFLQWLKPKSASEEGVILCKQEELQRENKSLRGKVSSDFTTTSRLVVCACSKGNAYS